MASTDSIINRDAVASSSSVYLPSSFEASFIKVFIRLWNYFPLEKFHPKPGVWFVSNMSFFQLLCMQYKGFYEFGLPVSSVTIVRISAFYLNIIIKSK